MQYKHKLLFTSVAFLTAMGAVALVWWLTDRSSAHHFLTAQGPTTLKYAAPALVALVGWTGKQLLASRSKRSTPGQLMQAQQALARRGLEWWRGVPEPAWPGRLLRAGLRPLDVPWVASPPAGIAAAKDLAGTEITDLAAWLRKGRNCRLVIHGEASSGKSVLARQLMAELLKRRGPDDPAPVFFPLWSWNPEQQSLYDWMKYRIRLTYPELGEEATYGPSAIADLVDQGRVLPILDGLDALPWACRVQVFRQGEVMSQTPLIVTSRTDVIKSIDHTDVIKSIDDFVMIEPGRIPNEESSRFLREITGKNGFAKLKCQLADAVGVGANGKELRRVLSRPRTIYLASIVYQAPPEKYDPATQSDTAPSPDARARVDRFLLGNLIPALLPAGASWCRTFPWYATDAAKWLKRLAQLDLRDPNDRRPALDPPDDPGDLEDPLGGTDLDDPAASRIAWWNLHRSIPLLDKYQAPLRGLVAGLIAFGAGTLIFRYYPRGYGWGYGLRTAGGYGLLIFIASSFLGGAHSPEPDIRPANGNSRLATLWWIVRYYWPRWWRIMLAAFFGFCCFGILIGWRVSRETGHTPQQGASTGFWVGFIQGAVLLVLICIIAGVPAAPRTVKASDFPTPGRPWTKTFAAALLLGVAFGLLWGAGAVLKHENSHVPSLWPALGTGLITGVDFALGAWLFRRSRNWFMSPLVSNPRLAAQQDLAGAIVRPFILAATFAFSFGITAPFHFVDSYVCPWFVVGLAFGSLDTEWPLYVAAISWLALAKRDLPLRLNRFLECCRAAGIVRVIGQEYQIHDIGLVRWLSSRTVTICRRGSLGLYADDRGVTIRNSAFRARQFAWNEISRFADGSRRQSLLFHHYDWILHIVPEKGRTVSVKCTKHSPAPETLTAVRQVAERYGIPAKLDGVPMKDGHPPGPGLYEDPGGQADRLRYWDGTQWSPLLPQDFSKSTTGAKNPDSWSALPMANGHWAYAAIKATSWTAGFAVFTAVSAALLTVGLVIDLLWDRGTYHSHVIAVWFWISSGYAALYALVTWGNRRFFRKLDAAANGHGGRLGTLRVDPASAPALATPSQATQAGATATPGRAHANGQGVSKVNWDPL